MTQTLVRNLKYGVEIEFTNDVREDLKRELVRRGLSAVVLSGVDHNDYGRTWKIERDASCGYELVSPILTDLVELKKACESLQAAGCKVDKSCGLHVHHDAHDFNLDNIKNVYRLYSKHESIIDNMMPASRRGNTNTYCKSIVGDKVAEVERMTSIDQMMEIVGGRYEGHYTSRRYYKVNFCSYVCYGTIEFRQHSGTTEFDKISNWVVLTNRIMEQAKNLKKVNPKTRKWLELETAEPSYKVRALNLDLNIGGTDLALYVGKRIKNFKQREAEVA
jgi:hypothetical protein